MVKKKQPDCKKYSIMVFDNHTGELVMDIESESVQFEVQNNFQHATSWLEPDLKFHTHTLVDRYIEFANGTLSLPDIKPRDPKLDRRAFGG